MFGRRGRRLVDPDRRRRTRHGDVLAGGLPDSIVEPCTAGVDRLVLVVRLFPPQADRATDVGAAGAGNGLAVGPPRQPSHGHGRV